MVAVQLEGPLPNYVLKKSSKWVGGEVMSVEEMKSAESLDIPPVAAVQADPLYAGDDFCCISPMLFKFILSFNDDDISLYLSFIHSFIHYRPSGMEEYETAEVALPTPTSQLFFEVHYYHYYYYSHSFSIIL